MTNLPTLAEVAGDAGLCHSLELDALDALLSKADETIREAGVAKAAMRAEIEARYGAQISAAFLSAGKDTGTVHVAVDGYDLAVDRAKRVDWDQAKLQALRAEIVAAGDNPDQYFKAELSVSEASFKAWPDYLKRKFEPARTLKPGALSFKLTPAALRNARAA